VHDVTVRVCDACMQPVVRDALQNEPAYKALWKIYEQVRVMRACAIWCCVACDRTVGIVRDYGVVTGDASGERQALLGAAGAQERQQDCAQEMNCIFTRIAAGVWSHATTQRTLLASPTARCGSAGRRAGAD
jgi:hypothetical protein